MARESSVTPLQQFHFTLTAALIYADLFENESFLCYFAAYARIRLRRCSLR
jgi:hypothetical protein